MIERAKDEGVLRATPVAGAPQRVAPSYRAGSSAGVVSREGILFLQRHAGNAAAGRALAGTPRPLQRVVHEGGEPGRRPNMVEGDSGPGVTLWQKRLGARQTGVFDAATRQATDRFQRQMGWEPSGVGPMSWQMLEGHAGVPGRRPNLVAADRGPGVAVLQGLLGVAVTSVFDSATRKAADEFQRAQGWDPSGVGPLTWKALDERTAPGAAAGEAARKLSGSLVVGGVQIGAGDLVFSMEPAGTLVSPGPETARGEARLDGASLALGMSVVAFTGGGGPSAGGVGGAFTASPGAGASQGLYTVNGVQTASQQAARIAYQQQLRLVASRGATALTTTAPRVAVFSVVLRTGVVLFFVVGVPLAIYQIATHEGEWAAPWAEYCREVEARLGPMGGAAAPGGRPPSGAYPGEPAEAPGAGPAAPARDPGTTDPAQAPGATGHGRPASLPGAHEGESAQAPGGVVDSPAECKKRNLAKEKHDHHIFPQEFEPEFRRIGIVPDERTITIPGDEHIGNNGIHKVFDWNGEWQDFLDDIPTGPLTKEAKARWQKAAEDLASILLAKAGMSHYKVHPYRLRP